MRNFHEYPDPEDIYLRESELYMKYKHLPDHERAYLMSRVKCICSELRAKKQKEQQREKQKQKQHEKELEKKIAKAAEEQIGKAFDEVFKDLFK